VFVPFAPDDSGNSIGAALWAANRAGEPIGRGNGLTCPFLGTSYDDEAVRQALERFRLSYSRVDDAAETAADLLAEGRIVGWFQGRMEFGQRALGARSILADPRDPGMKDKINAAVKFRESFRPFAPAVLAEAVDTWFDAPAGSKVPFMEKVFPIRADKRSLIPAVVHADGTGRLQTVERETQPLFHRLIEAFARRTNVPIVLNTSFNLNGEPIVESPADAVRTFMTSGMDALLIGHYLLCKA
jgi:carbamoyltransferase